MSKTSLISDLYQAFSEKNLNRLAELCSSDIIWKQNPGFPGGGVHRGVESIIKNVFEANISRWSSFSFKINSISECHQKVLVEGAYVVRSKKTEKLIEAQACHVYQFSENKVIEFQQYTDTKILWDHYDLATS